MMRKKSYGVSMVAAYFLVHGALYAMSPFILERFGIWSSYLTFLLGNVTISNLFPVPFVIGGAYVAVGIGLLYGRHWARIGLFVLCVQAVFLEFPIGTAIAMVILVYSFTVPFSKAFPGKTRKSMYQVTGLFLVITCIVSFLVVTGVTSGVIRFTAYQVAGIELSSESPESKIATVTQRVGLIDVLIELSGSVEYAMEQQDIFLSEIGQYINIVKERIVLSSNALIVNMEASNLLAVAESEHVTRINPVVPSVQFLPVTPSDTVTSYLAPMQLNVEMLHEKGLTGKGITVAIMDTGIKEDHPDLQRDGRSIVVGGLYLHGKYIHPHGTMVASCIANQNEQWKGIAPDVTLLNIEVFSWQTIGGVRYLSATNADILKGFEFVANWKELTGDYIVLSCSWGVSAETWSHDANAIAAAANRLAVQFNIPIVAAAGNSGPGGVRYTSIPFQLMSPAGGQNVLSVGAVDNNNNIASFSSRGPYYDGREKPDVVAPGVNVPVLDYTGVTVVSGTSFAAPYVSGVAALLLQRNKDMSSIQLYDAIRAGAVDLGVEGFDYEYGHGLVNGERSLLYVEQTLSEQGILLLIASTAVVGMLIMVYPALQRKQRR